jgi:glycosyltransferase involved in cell wall biosynthesis
MRVLHVCRDRGEGGANRAIESIARETAHRGVEVHILAGAGPYDYHLPTKDIPILNRKVMRVPTVASSLWRNLRELSPDVVQVHSIGYALAITPLTVLLDIPLILGIHGLPAEDYARVGFGLRHLPGTIIAYGPGTAKILQRHHVSHRLIYYGISPAPDAASRAVLEHVTQSKDTKFILSAGRLVPQKNHEVLIRSLRYIPDAHLVILGEGPLRSSLVQTAEDLGLSDRTHLLGFRNDARALMAAADVVAIPSTWEGFGLAAAEAMLAGTPLVAGRAPGLEEWVAHKETGLLVDPHDPEEIGTALGRILSDGTFATALASAAQTFASQLTLEHMAESHLELYAELMRNPSRAHRTKDRRPRRAEVR